jgi:hypothetical protein
MAGGETNSQDAGQLGKDLSAAFEMPSIKEFGANLERISSSARMINNLFGQSRERIVELQQEIANAQPAINRLGGNVGDVTNTIMEAASASRRNVVASTEDIEKLYASTKVLGGSVEGLTNGFLDVGIGIEQMGKQLEDSVNYVRSIGGNTKQVMDSVRNNMDQMNRYQFEGGVQGLTKMAAQASMLRFDMSNTFAMAEKVLTPDGAIEMASAFQRLGVSAGALADPFALMNQSINDPSGLQNSLAEVSKQFTYFDEKTKTFKINPQGVLTLREMEKEAGIAQGSLSKMGLAAAELDARLSDVNKAGLSIASEEDKQYLANIATMQNGKYVVTLEDGVEKELAELTQPEFDKLIDEQKKGPKTMEEIAKSQMSISEDISGNVTAIRNAFIGGMITQKDVLQAVENTRGAASTVTGDISRNLSSPQAVRDTLTESMGDLKELFSDMKNKNVTTTEALSTYFEKLGTQGIKVQEGLRDSLVKGLEQSRAKLEKDGGDSTIKQMSEEFLGSMISGIKSGKVQGTETGNMPVSSLIEGTKSSSVATQKAMSKALSSGGATSNVKVDGGFKIDINFTGLSGDLTPSQKEQITKVLIDKLNTTEVQQYMVSVTGKNDPTKAPTGKVLGP